MFVLWGFTYILRNLVLDLPSVVSNGGDIFVCVLPSHDISDLKVSKLCPLLKATHWTFSRERSRKSKTIQKNKKNWNWLLEILVFLTIFAKTFHHVCSTGSKYVSGYNSFVTDVSIIQKPVHCKKMLQKKIKISFKVCCYLQSQKVCASTKENHAMFQKKLPFEWDC